jgi:hypothetical protein
MLGLAVLPTSVGLLLCLHILGTDGVGSLRWTQPMWGVVISHVLAVIAFIGCVIENRALGPEERDHWITQIVVFIPFGMLAYWMRYFSTLRGN